MNKFGKRKDRKYLEGMVTDKGFCAAGALIGPEIVPWQDTNKSVNIEEFFHSKPQIIHSMAHRQKPKDCYKALPSSYVAVANAYEDIMQMKYPFSFSRKDISGMNEDGRLSLDNMNKYVRSHLAIKKKEAFKKDKRIKLKDFLKENKANCVVSAGGHYFYVKGDEYFSFYDNLNDKVACSWVLK